MMAAQMKTVPAEPRFPAPQTKRLYYVFSWLDRIGEATQQLFQARAICREEKRPLTIITPEYTPEQLANPEVMEILLRDVDHIIWPFDRFIETLQAFIPTIGDAGELFPPYKTGLLRTYFRTKFIQGKMPEFYTLSAADHARGQALRQRLGVPPDAKTITLHVREAGYLETISPQPGYYAYHKYRDAEIDRYLPAIEYLTQKEGYWVIRIGDRTMKPLPAMAQVIDAPFHPVQDSFLDPYFCAVSDFYLGMPSGPYTLAAMFGTPVLCTNAIIAHYEYGFHFDMFLYKKYFSRQLGRYLTYEEVLMSHIAEFQGQEEFEKGQIELHENEPGDLLDATREMLARLRKRYNSPDETRIQSHFRTMHEKAHHLRRGTCPEHRYSSLFLSTAKVSTEYYSKHPELIGVPLCQEHLYKYFVQKQCAG